MVIAIVEVAVGGCDGCYLSLSIGSRGSKICYYDRCLGLRGR